MPTLRWRTNYSVRLSYSYDVQWARTNTAYKNWATSWSQLGTTFFWNNHSVKHTTGDLTFPRFIKRESSWIVTITEETSIPVEITSGIVLFKLSQKFTCDSGLLLLCQLTKQRKNFHFMLKNSWVVNAWASAGLYYNRQRSVSVMFPTGASCTCSCLSLSSHSID